MIQRFDRRERRILRIQTVRPCESVPPETLLESLITSSENIIRFPTKSLATQRRKAREIIRQASILSIFFEELRGRTGESSDSSVVLCLSELHVAFQKIELLLEDCAREGSKLFILMKSHEASAQFTAVAGALATALDVLPLESIDVSLETKELVEMLSEQSRRAKMEVEAEDEEAMKRVILVLNQFENKFEPDPFLTRKIIAQMGIGSWAECNNEVKFLEDEVRRAYSDGGDEQGEVHLLSGLMGFLCYCRGTLFDDCDDFDVLDQTDGRNSSVEALSCLNPKDFQCPISLELMTDPVIVSTGQTYDRSSIQKWLKSGNSTCPKTGEVLANTELVPNTNLKKVIHQFCAEYGVSLANSRTKNRDISRTILPGSPAYAEAIKFLAVFLCLTLTYGSDRQKKKAAFEVRLLAKSNLFNRGCLIEAGAVQPLLELLDSTDELLQENAVSALLKLSKQPKGQKEIMGSKGLSPILKVLKNGAKPESKQIAAAVVFYLCSVQKYRKTIGENPEAIPSLLELVKHGTPCGKKNSVPALFALLIHHRNRRRAITAGAVPALLNLLESSEKPEVKVDALAVVSTLADSFEGSLEILNASALPLVLRSLQTVETRAGKEYCVSTLHSLCLNCGADVISVLAKDGSLMSELYSLLTEGTSHAGRKARSLIKILQRFCESRSSDLGREIRRESYVNVR